MESFASPSKPLKVLFPCGERMREERGGKGREKGKTISLCFLGRNLGRERKREQKYFFRFPLLGFCQN